MLIHQLLVRTDDSDASTPTAVRGRPITGGMLPFLTTCIRLWLPLLILFLLRIKHINFRRRAYHFTPSLLRPWLFLVRRGPRQRLVQMGRQSILQLARISRQINAHLLELVDQHPRR